MKGAGAEVARASARREAPVHESGGGSKCMAQVGTDLDKSRAACPPEARWRYDGRKLARVNP